MSVTYQQLLHNVALRVNALVGAQVATLAATYDTEPLTAANFKSANFPFNSFRDAILMAEADFAWAIADTGNHPWRTVLAGSTIGLGNTDEIPINDDQGHPIIGVYGTIYDSNDFHALTEQPLEVVQRIAAESWRTYPLYYFKLDGRRIFHTRDQVIISVCTFSRTLRLAAWASNGDMLLPDVLEPGISARAISLMFRDGLYDVQAAKYREYSDQALIMVRSGETNVAAKSLPAPTLGETAS